MDPSAVEQGRKYRLRSIEDVVSEERLAIAINGTLFTLELDLAPAVCRRLRQRAKRWFHVVKPFSEHI